ncbi:MAG: LytS/YhcK type 5TM receptor domain-containing protein [Bacillota bacterium]
MNYSAVPDLLFTLFKSMSVIVTFAYILSRINSIKNFFISPMKRLEKTFLILFFGILSLLGTYLGIFILEAYANIRGIGAFMGGLLGGPAVGVLAGMIGGIHRYSLGGFTAFACAVGTITTGFMGGLFHKKYLKGQVNFKNGFFIGLLALSIEMIIVLFLSNPFSQALQLVKVIAIPMVLTNAAGISIFISILNKVNEEHEKIRALQAEKALSIADRSLPILQKGLNEETASIIVNMIKKESSIDAAAITDCEKVLAFTGVGSDHHLPGEKIKTNASKKALNKKITTIIDKKENIGCDAENCSLTNAVITPLKIEDNIFGLLKLYRSEEKITVLDIKLAEGISSLLATQIKLGKLSEEAKLKSESELKALQAQINPHFLFNSLNVIISACRIDPQQSRTLLRKLANIFRRTLKRNVNQTTLADEIKFCRDYLDIEKARLGERLEIKWNIDDSIMKYKIPPFIIQPLVENSIKHGIYPKEGKGLVSISAKNENNKLKINVKDNGSGMNKERLNNLFSEKQDRIGLKNIKERLDVIYNESAHFIIDSSPNNGTEISITLPADYFEERRAAN